MPKLSAPLHRVLPGIMVAICLWLGAEPARALIPYNSGSNANTYNLTDPGLTNTTAAESLWNHVAQVRAPDGVTPDASAVYIGRGYLLTANHVGGTRYFIMGKEYLPDTSFGTNGQKTIALSSGQGIDLKLIKLTTLPPLPGVPMLSSTDTATNSLSIFMGWGVGKGSPIDSQGWLWGGSNTAALRWGANITDSETYTDASHPYTFLYTFFDRALTLPAPYSADDVFNISLGDSGGALFQNVNGAWKLAGIGDAVSTWNIAYYDSDRNTGGDQPDASFYIDLQVHSADVQRQIPAPVSVRVPWFIALAFALLYASLLSDQSVTYRGKDHPRT